MKVLLTNNIFCQEEQWKAIYHASSTATPFQSWDWIRISCQENRKILFANGFIGDDLVGIWPLEIRGGIARYSAHSVSDYQHPLLTENAKDLAPQFLQELTKTLGKTITVDLGELPQSLGFEGQIHSVCPRLKLSHSFEEIVANINSKTMRRDVRKGLRTSELRQVTVSAEKFAKHFFALHDARWKQQDLPSGLKAGIRKFHENYLAQSPPEFKGELLTYEEKAIGAIYLLHKGSTTYFYQSGWDPEYQSLSPGTLMVAFAIRNAISRGDTLFDFCRGNEYYKTRWLNSKLPGVTETGVNVRVAKGILSPIVNTSRSLEKAYRRFTGQLPKSIPT